MYCGKMADLMVVLFGMVGQVRWGPNPGKGQILGEMVQCIGCAKIAEPIESFGMSV